MYKYKVNYTIEASDYYRNLPPEAQLQIRERARELSTNPITGSKLLKGPFLGDRSTLTRQAYFTKHRCQLIYRMDHGTTVITILAIRCFEVYGS